MIRDNEVRSLPEIVAPETCSTRVGSTFFQIRLERLARDKCSSLFGFIISDKEKGFITLMPG
jgi:hypothetical protein